MLPRAVEEFKTKEYWDKFFEKRGQAAFEWYGSYKNYKAILNKEMTAKNRVLVLGCGTSLMSEEMYDDGYQNITSIDYSENVVAAMEARKKDRKISYTVMDATNLKFPAESFDTMIDKATLDAIFCNEASDTISVVEKMWENCFRTLCNKGKYICISLLQQHILSKVFSYFLNGNHNPLFADRAFIVRIYEAEAELSVQAEQKHVPFVLVIEQSKVDPKSEAAVKVKEMFSKTVYYIAQKVETVTVDSAIKRVKERQMFGFVLSQSKSFEKGQRFKIKCYDSNSKLEIPKYIMTVVDSKNEKVLRKKTCGVFIAPLGRENDYLFATEEGNFYLQSDSKYSRLIIVTLNHLHSFGPIEQIQKELSPKVMALVPAECTNKDKIPYLKIGETIGKRETVYHDKGIIIEDVEDFDGAVIRRLFFESKIEQVQSEVNLKSVPKGSLEPAVVPTKSVLFPADEKTQVVINHRVLCSDYARAMVAGMSAISHTIISKPQFKVMVLGTGAGVFPMFIKQNIPTAIVQTVDNDPEILKLGEGYFGFKPDERMISYCTDAESLLNAIYEKKEPNPYDLVVVDLNNPDLSTGISPDQKFYSGEFLKNLKAHAGDNEFAVVINMLFRGNEDKYKEAIEEFKAVFDVVFSMKSDKEANEVFFMISKAPGQAVTPGNYQKTTMNTHIHILQKHLGVDWTKGMNTLEHIDGMKLHKPKEGIKEGGAKEGKKKKKSKK